MTRTAVGLGAAALLLVRVLSGAPAAPAGPATADQVVARMVDGWRTTGVRARSTLTRTITGTNEKQVRQILVKARRGRAARSVLYQQLWPVVEGGRALVLDDAGDHRVRGFLYEAGRVTPLSDRMLADRVFDSDLLIEDVADAFWYWPLRRIAGQEAVGAYDCTIVELRPSPGTSTGYGLVKAWVSPDQALALRLEQFGRDGRLVKQIALFRVVKDSGRWVPTILTVEPADGRSRTVLESTKFEQDLNLPASDFTVDGVRKSVRTPD